MAPKRRSSCMVGDCIMQAECKVDVLCSDPG